MIKAILIALVVCSAFSLPSGDKMKKIPVY